MEVRPRSLKQSVVSTVTVDLLWCSVCLVTGRPEASLHTGWTIDGVTVYLQFYFLQIRIMPIPDFCYFLKVSLLSKAYKKQQIAEDGILNYFLPVVKKKVFFLPVVKKILN